MRFEVFLTENAARDLEEIHGYIATHDAPAKAEYVLDRIEEVIESLATFPERGAFPREFHALGIREYRETRFKPYRVIYRIMGKRIYICLLYTSPSPRD